MQNNNINLPGNIATWSLSTYMYSEKYTKIVPNVYFDFDAKWLIVYELTKMINCRLSEFWPMCLEHRV